MRRVVLDALRAVAAARESAVLVTDTATGRQCLLRAAGALGDLDLDADLAARAGRAERSGLLPDAPHLFVRRIVPPPRLAIVGAVHIARALAPMAGIVGYEVTVIEPRAAFARDGNWDGASVVERWPDEAVADLLPDSDTAVVALTHDPKLDDAALSAALRTPAFYVGALGSRRSHAARHRRLVESGIPPEALDRIRGPVGLDIGAWSPAEIAVSILAEMTLVRNGPRWPERMA